MPSAAPPDLWEARQLAEFDRRAASGEKPETLEKSEVVTIDGKQVFRYMKALPVSEVCLEAATARPTDSIAGPQGRNSPGAYPHDQATGYGQGQVRGALTVKRPL
jgi:hypothetical protein